MFNWKYIALLFLLLVSAGVKSAGILTLTPNSIGNLPLSINSPISIEAIEAAFPAYKIEYQLGDNEAGSIHLVTVTDREELLFFMISYISIGDGRSKNAKEFPIDLLVVKSTKIVDSFDIKVGDKISKAFSNRPDELVFRANHFDNAFGANRIFYNFQVTPEQELHKEIGYIPAEIVTPEYAIQDDPKIIAISWPINRW